MKKYIVQMNEVIAGETTLQHLNTTRDCDHRRSITGTVFIGCSYRLGYVYLIQVKFEIIMKMTLGERRVIK